MLGLLCLQIVTIYFYDIDAKFDLNDFLRQVKNHSPTNGVRPSLVGNTRTRELSYFLPFLLFVIPSSLTIIYSIRVL